MSKNIVSLYFLGILLAPGLGLADEIEPNFDAGYRMGYFMAVAAGNLDVKVCGRVHFLTISEAIKEYAAVHGPKYPLKHNEVLALMEKTFPCQKDVTTNSGK